MASTLTPEMSCIKLLLFIFNLIFWVAGIVLIAVASIAIHNFKNYHKAIQSDILEAAPILLIIIGIIILIFAFFGCYGAIKENTCFLSTFAVLLIIIFILEMGAAIAAFVYRNKLDSDSIHKTMNNSLENYKPEDGYKLWDFMQDTFKCCGVDNKLDWKKNPNFNDTLPTSCCKDDTNCTLTSTDVYEKGCYRVIIDGINYYAGAIGGVGIGIAVVEVAGIILACCLVRGIRFSYETV